MRLAPIISRVKLSPDFPGSSATDKQWLEITLDGISQTIATWLSLVEHSTRGNLVVVKTVSESYEMTEDSKALRNLFDCYGSDKGSRHQYDLIYSFLMRNQKDRKVSVLEIGLGTNNTDTPSNMGKLGKPGASLRAWRDYFTEGEIIGCDIDSRVLFTEERIKTFQLDQTSDDSWKIFIENSKIKKFDLIIDDGLHAPFANLVTLKNSMKLLTPGGILVIEDITESAVPLWQLIAITLQSVYKIDLVRTNLSYIAIFSKE